jgi:hypothetical protein
MTPCSGDAGWAPLPVGAAVVRKIRSPQITGVEKPRPGIAIFHLLFFRVAEFGRRCGAGHAVKERRAPPRPMREVGICGTGDQYNRRQLNQRQHAANGGQSFSRFINPL